MNAFPMRESDLIIGNTTPKLLSNMIIMTYEYMICIISNLYPEDHMIYTYATRCIVLTIIICPVIGHVCTICYCH